MTGEIILVGGEEFRPGCEDMDREILLASGQDPSRVLIIPTAAVSNPAKAANDGVTHFGKLGAKAAKLMVLDRSQADDAAFVQAAEEAGVVYFTGGSPEHLLATLKDSQLLRSILAASDRGAVLAGSSAGAMVMGSYMIPSGSGEWWVETLGIAPRIAVFPHHERRNPADTSRELGDRVPTGVTVLGIDAQTGCLGRPGSWRVVGSGNVTVYQSGKWQMYGSGQPLPSNV